MRTASGASIALLLAVTLGVVAACGERFTGIDDVPDESGGSDGAGNDSSGAKSPGGAGRGGKPSTAGAGGASAGEPGTGGSIDIGGLPSVGGVVGTGGSMEIPPLPVEDGLELWLRADEGVMEVGEYVATWKDSSVHHRDATQSATNYRPRLAKDAMSGRTGIVFDGMDDYLRLPAFDADFAKGVSIFAVALQEEGAECDAIFEASNGSEIEDVHLGDWKGSPIYEVGATYVHASDAPTVYGKPELLAAVHTETSTVQLRRNSTGLGIMEQFALPPKVTRAETFIGRSLYAECGTWNGGIAEVLVYSRGVSEEELVEIETYLQKKWGCCTE